MFIRADRLAKGKSLMELVIKEMVSMLPILLHCLFFSILNVSCPYK